MKESLNLIHLSAITLANLVTQSNRSDNIIINCAKKLKSDTNLLKTAWSDMAVRNLLSDMSRNIKQIRNAHITTRPRSSALNAITITKFNNTTRNRSNALNQQAFKHFNIDETGITTRNRSNQGNFEFSSQIDDLCSSLLGCIDEELQLHSPNHSRYNHVVCLGYKVPVSSNQYSGQEDDYADMLERCQWLKNAIKAAYQLSNQGVGKNYSNNPHILKLFVAPEFYFRGRNGAYDHKIVHGTKGKKGLVEIMLEEIGQPQYKDWLFVLGTAVAATKTSSWVCTECNSKVVLTKQGNKTIPHCSIHKNHKTEEKTIGALVENVCLIVKEGNVHTVTKEFVSHVDYNNGLVTVRGETLNVVTQSIKNQQGHTYELANPVQTKFKDERMGGCIFTVDGITMGVEICLDHSVGRLQNSTNVQIQIIPSAGMNICNINTIQDGIVFNVDSSHVRVVANNQLELEGITFKSQTWRGLMDHVQTMVTLRDYNFSFTQQDFQEYDIPINLFQKATPAPVLSKMGQGEILLYGPYYIPKP